MVARKRAGRGGKAGKQGSGKGISKSNRGAELGEDGESRMAVTQRCEWSLRRRRLEAGQGWTAEGPGC